MNPQHLRTFIWLRYRLRVNQLKRGGIVNSILLTLLAVAAIGASVGLFVGGFLVGWLALRTAPPVVRLLVWDGIAIAFLFSWMIGLLTDLQRTDGLSLDKFLHLPVSPFGAFLINYVSSLFSISLILFVPGMTGLILGQVFAAGPQMLLALPLLAAFILAVTGLTYQFQGWLASMMMNPRRRRTVVVVITLSFILFAQLPNLINIIRPWENKGQKPGPRYTERLKELSDSFKDGKLTPEEYQKQSAEAQREYEADIKRSTQMDWDGTMRTARILNTALPPGWLALGAADLAEGAMQTALLGGLGLTLIGAFSLGRAYRTTLRMYTGHNPGSGGKAGRPVAAAPSGPQKTRLIEWQLPGVPEHAAAVGVAGLRSFLRAPEAKIALIVPIILVVVFGSLFLSIGSAPPLTVRPLFAFGATAMVLLCSVQLIGNQFGYDRGGFRVFVLSPVSRRDVLFGKNLALAPLVLGPIAAAIVVLECVCPMRIDHFLAAFAQALGMFLLFCLLANVISIAVPQPIAAGAMKPSQVKLTPVLAQFALLFAFPMVIAPLLFPLGIEALLSEVTGIAFLPIALPLTLGLVAGIVLVYRQGLTALGRFLATREQKILEVVTSKSE